MLRPFLKFAGTLIFIFIGAQNVFGSECQKPFKWQDKRLSLVERVNEFNKCEYKKASDRLGKYFCYTEHKVGTDFTLNDGTLNHSGSFATDPQKFFITIKRVELRDELKQLKCLDLGMLDTANPIVGPPGGSPGGICFANFSLNISVNDNLFFGEKLFVSYNAFRWRGLSDSFYLDVHNNFTWHQNIIKNNYLLSGICEKIN
jgi:hypothetical protein